MPSTPSVPSAPGESRWSQATLRFLFVYFLLAFPFGEVPTELAVLAGLWDDDPLFPIYRTVGSLVFGVEVQSTEIGISDTAYDWLRCGADLVFALLATVVWSVRAKGRPVHPWLQDGLRSAMRLVLATAMLVYGIGKLGESQFRVPGCTTLLEPVGEFTPTELLWCFMGASRPYTVFTGWVEVVGGILLAFRRTQLVGALWTAGVMTNVVALNICYDVPVKILASHLLFLALAIAVPDLPRLVAMFVRNEATQPADLIGPWTRPSLRRAAVGCKFAWLGLVAAAAGAMVWTRHQENSAQAPRGELDGTWEVTSFRRDGVVEPPVLTDAARWRRLTLVDRDFLRQAVATAMSGERQYWILQVADGAITLRKPVAAAGDMPTPGDVDGVLRFTREGDRGLQLVGEVRGERIEAVCRRIERTDFPLAARGIRWVNEPPYMR